MKPGSSSSRVGVSSLLLLSGCLINQDLYDARFEELTTPEASDVDGDGYTTESDCDDTNAAAHPGGTEIPYDGIDQDCLGGDVDDVDLDGFAASTVGGQDCDDGDAGTFPEAVESWANGVTDNDCDGTRETIRHEFGTEVWTGERAGDGLGRRVVGLGDIDGDGLADVGVGSDIDSTVGVAGGALYRLSGPAGGSVVSAAGLFPSSAGGAFTSDLDGGADATGDGVPDLLVSAVGNADTLAAAWLVDGERWRSGGSAVVDDVSVDVVRATALGAYAPSSVRFLGDVTGDGVEDIAVGDCCWDPTGGSRALGRVAIYSADTFGGTLDDADVILTGTDEGGYAGFDVDTLGDQDGDGLGELLVSGSGVVAAIVPGTTSGSLPDRAITVVYGAAARNFPVARGISDVDADGRDDLAIVGEEGTLYLFTALAGSLTRGLESPTFQLTWESGGVYDVLPLGDLDGDDRAELFVPLAWSSTGTQRAWILFGDSVRYGTTLDASELGLSAVSVIPSALFGYRIDHAGDVDGDGQDDIVVGGPDYAAGGGGAGGATLLPVPR